MFTDKFDDLIGPIGLQDIIRRTSVSTVVSTVLAVTLVSIALDYTRMLWLRSKMPPGPLPYPIVGNTFMLPDHKPWIWFEELSQKYNAPLITIWIGRSPTVWINDAWAASDLFDKRAGIYSSRPRMLVFAELGSGQSNLVNMYTWTPEQRERWRLHRKLMHHAVGVQQVRKYHGFQDDESRVVAYELLSSPDDYVKHFERYATSVVSIIGFGRRVESSEDPIITEVIAVMQLAAELNVPGKTLPMLMETFPLLAKFPHAIAPWKRGLGRKRSSGFFYAIADEASKKPEHDSSPSSFAKHLFAERARHGLDEDEIASLSGNLFGAGSDTSSSTLVTFVLACCAFPDALAPAREELDRVVGPGRSPGLGDRPGLPYVGAFVREVLRWRSVAVMGGQPHSPARDDVYRGWLIPRGTWVQGNVWAIHHNEREFPDPDRFNPKRYLPGDPDSRPFPGDKGYMTFGWGRRVCSGQALAEQGTWITVARLLWGFHIQKKRRADGGVVEVDIFNYTNGLNMRPRPFECSIEPRSDEIRQTIEREGQQALRDLEQYRGESKYRMSTFYQRNDVAMKMFGEVVK